MKIFLIAAMDKNRAIGKNNSLPWSIPEDLKFFRKTTQHKPVIMGRKTFESIGRVLPNRPNIILTRDKSFNVQEKGAFVVNSKEEALKIASSFPCENVMVIGGSEIYKIFLNDAEGLYLTEVETQVAGADAFFPNFNEKIFKNKKLLQHFEKTEKTPEFNIFYYSRN